MSAKCKYLIYTCLEKSLESGISLMHDLCPQTEEEAKQMVTELKKSSETFYEKFLILNTSRNYIYIENKGYSWPK